MHPIAIAFAIVECANRQCGISPAVAITARHQQGGAPPTIAVAVHHRQRDASRNTAFAFAVRAH
jgi:hypothetical protein